MGMKIGKYVNSKIKKIHFNKFIIFADMNIFLGKTDQYNLVTKFMFFGRVMILISDAELSSNIRY